MSVVSFDINTGQTTGHLKFPLAEYPVAFYDQYFYTFDDPTLTDVIRTVSKHLLSDGSAIWSKSIDGKYGFGLTITPGFIYYSSTPVTTTRGPQTMNILDQGTGKILRQYPVYTNLSFSPTVVDSTGKAWYQIR